MQLHFRGQDPSDISRREYYKVRWGFDPTSDTIRLKKGWHRYETWFPLTQDPDFWNADVEIGARVDWREQKVTNAIVFRSPESEARVECSHTVIYAGHEEDVYELANDALSLADEYPSLSPAHLPPEEHFAALKSYVAGIAEIGLGTLFRASYLSSEFDPENSFAGFNSLMQKQIAGALLKVAPGSGRVFLRSFLLDLVANVPPEWLEQRLAYLDSTYDISKVLFHDANALAIAKEQFPTLPWDQWAAAVEVKWDDLKDWAEWFERIENLPKKNLFNYGLPDIGVDYAIFAKTLRDSTEEELADKFIIDFEFAGNSQKIFHVVIEEGLWGGADVPKLTLVKRSLTMEVIGAYISIFIGYWIAGPGLIAIIIGACLGISNVAAIELWKWLRGKKIGKQLKKQKEIDAL